MNAAVNALFAEYLEHTGGDRAAAATLTLAAVMQQERAPVQPAAALTVDEAAVRLRTHRATIYRLCRCGKLHCYRAGRVLRIPLEEVERFERQTGLTAFASYCFAAEAPDDRFPWALRVDGFGLTAVRPFVSGAPNREPAYRCATGMSMNCGSPGGATNEMRTVPVRGSLAKR